MAKKRWCAAALLAVLIFGMNPGAISQPVEPLTELPDAPASNLPQLSSSDQSATPPPSASGSQGVAGQNQQPAVPLTSEQQLKQQEQQRVFGVMATFNTTTNKDALPLTSGQKYRLFFKSATDPWPFLLTAFSAGVDQAQGSFREYGGGIGGYGKRWGASYTDYFTGNLLGNAVLASLLKEDPRYYQKGKGSFLGRAGWAATSTVWCKRDSGSWGPNYANVMGNLMGAAVSNLYYPESDRTASGTIERGISVTAQAIVGSEIIEFWPDIARHYKRKKAEKLARQAAAATTPVAPKP